MLVFLFREGRYGKGDKKLFRARVWGFGWRD